MTYDVKILADSIAQGVRLTSLAATYPRIIHSEVMTHRMLSRNAASSRAIPVEKSIERVLADPFVPEAFARNVRGMQGGSDFDYDTNELARENWKIGLRAAVKAAEGLALLGVHKHWANRLLEPYSWITTVITATEWENFFALRCHKDAAPEFQKIAGMMRERLAEQEYLQELKPGEWHLPFVYRDNSGPGGVFDGGLPDEQQVKLSVARCARVSYLTHEGKRDVDADLVLYDRLKSSGHMSPFEHAARVATEEDVEDFAHRAPAAGSFGEKVVIIPRRFIGNFRAPWIQHRKDLEGEAVFRG